MTDRVLHGHLMVEAPESFFDELAEAGWTSSRSTTRRSRTRRRSIAKARGAGMRVGMTLNLETPVEAVFPYLDELDDVMLMSIRPGWSGQELNPEVYPRLEAVRGEVDRRGLPRRAWSSTAGSRSTTRSGRSMREPPCWSPHRRSSRRPIPAAAARALAAIARGEVAA